MTGLRLQIMGPLRVWRGDEEIDLGPRQQRCLLAVLAANAGHPVGMADLLASIWGFTAPPSAVNVIHKYVGALRRLLEPELALRTPGSFILRTAGGYRFAAGPDVLDLAAFRELAAAGRALAVAGRADEALEHWTEALRLCHGPAGDALADSVGAAATFAAIDGEFCDAAVAAADRGDADTAWSLAGALRHAHPSDADDAARYVRASLQSSPNTATGSSTAP